MTEAADATPRGGRCLFGAAAGVLSLVVSAIALPGAARPATEPVLIAGARILDVRAGRYVEAAGVLVDGDRIAAVFSQDSAALPAGTRRIDLPDTTLVPGLGDMYASASPGDAAEADFYYSMALAYGVTSYRVVGARLPWAATQRARAGAGDILAPRLWIAGPRLDQHGTPGFSLRTVLDAAAARREVDAQASLGAQWIAVSAATEAEVYRAVVRGAHAAKLHVSGEAGATPGIELIRMGVDAIDRIGFFAKSRTEYEQAAAARPDYPAADPEAVVDFLWQHLPASDSKGAISLPARRRVFVIPMLASFNGTLGSAALRQDPAFAALPARWRAAMEARAHPAKWPGAARAERAAAVRGRLVKSLVAAGVRMATGVDTDGAGYGIPGAGVHRELALLVAAGLSPADAIRSATVHCAELLGSATSLGEIKTGFSADFIAVEGDPLRRIEDLLRIKLIIRGGEVIDRDALLAQAKRAGR